MSISPPLTVALPTDLTDRLRQSSDLNHDELLTLILADMHRRWRRNHSVTIETYCDLVPALRDDPDLVLDLIAAEALLREQSGQSVGSEDYARRFPEFASGIARRFALMTTVVDGALSAGVGAGCSPGTLVGEAPGEASPAEFRTRTRVRAAAPTRGLAEGEGDLLDAAIAIPGFRILGELGRGGMGVVDHAWQHVLNRPVAIKMILSGENADVAVRRRFLAEAEAIASLDGARQHRQGVRVRPARQ